MSESGPFKFASSQSADPPPVNVTQLMHLAGALDIAAAISAADDHTDSFGPDWEVPSERAGGESRRIGNKRKADKITRSAAEDFALLTSRTTSEHHAADFLSTVSNVIYFIPKLIYSFSVIFSPSADAAVILLSGCSVHDIEGPGKCCQGCSASGCRRQYSINARG